MASSTELLDVARTLSSQNGTEPPTDAARRRAVSSIYYAVFHKLARTAALRFAGSDRLESAAFSLLYRSFDHRTMRMVCEALQASTLKDKVRRSLHRSAISSDITRFAEIFPDLQAARHRADYDPRTVFSVSEVSALIREAETAIAAFDRADETEQTDILALMMVRGRD